MIKNMNIDLQNKIFNNNLITVVKNENVYLKINQIRIVMLNAKEREDLFEGILFFNFKYYFSK